MFEHEDKPPDSDVPSEDDRDFINDNDSSDNIISNSESEKESIMNSEDSDSYINPYMERNNELEREDIMKILSKSTEKDKQNQKR